ncbi:putative leucine-rich repeat receptor-like serine/threonine-protein kinase At2g24130 isoform X2 [Ziziphus jujuba]|uniref:Leucine-rich repeat receptor-like serine/threonine-protein kinase At2g24130 isoform X2 n=1 Tax=Ziziphus jujuba TaxID=326968 RepID=A0A6P6GAZ4_ZIZJJ|nr:putative leucine-rich repeat receptor-like serine/threonine-protein kinase At2g24130 isoform X2 [Ziziphus jujuba]
MVFNNTMFLLVLLRLHLVLLVSCLDYHQNPHHSLLKDKAALLAFKRTIVYDPYAILSNWNESVFVCDFNGVFCDKHRHRVAQLVLNDSELVGTLSPFLSNLTGLRNLTIINSHLYGTIPPEFSHLRHLHHLRLEKNNLHGPIPGSLALIRNLTVLTLLQNNFSGKIPPALFSNCTLLEILDISGNSFTGEVPIEIGKCRQLWNLNLYNNQFSGRLPLSLSNTTLVNLDVEYNHFSGELPIEIVKNQPKLRYLHLSYNDMVSHDGNTNLSPFFTSLGNCTELMELELAGMGHGGTLPDSIAKLGVNLVTLLLQENKLYGSIPPSIANLSSLMVLNLTTNLLNGTIPDEISQLSKLEQLFLSHNLFTSSIPKALGHMPHLGLLDLSHNKFSGEIPRSLGNLVRVNYLFLNNNLLSGKIPSTLGKCTDLYKLDLSHNGLTGAIPPEISGMSEIRIFINLSYNQLEGPLPIELSKLEDVQEMDLSSNNLSGSIFPQISSCIALRLINFSNNLLQGNLPESLGELKNLEVFDVSRNHLSGMIPVNLNKSGTLTFLNLSFNKFEGMIPLGVVFNSVTYTSFLENKHLCGAVPGIPKCSRKSLFRSRIFLAIFVVVIFIAGFLSTICCVIAFRHIKVLMSSQKTQIVRKPAALELIHNFPRITYRELSEATGGFDEQRLIGAGSYGRVYRGVLPDGSAIAVKVLQLQTGDSTKSFNRECQVLKRIRHRNLIRIVTACSLPDFKALVLPYMANGSLDRRLYPHSQTGLGSGSSDLSLIQRVNICSDIAEGMAYLHHHSPVRVIHCDLKPSNVLLNDDMTALVSDFGIARLVMTVGGNAAAENMGNSTVNLCGSIGYIAPGYRFGTNTSTKGDVYSFSILVLEMIF